ncbi:BON domain-containing protein [Caballeronia sp. LZ062]|uniref:BON domain-containing protein n=1 Tax=unclassified Caballeronia TaxID=2646786 RepID=UPI002854D95D|nr:MULTISPECIES: BON domain-containing protein [unclassified Caballeronia]MDR5856590.1 BON domain-containing protein [Caballeronia sp. LZ050]MDR5873260.1 BON domain-containing protein [Caballeronia sp. LZ062]
MSNRLKLYVLVSALCGSVAVAHAQATSDVAASADAASAPHQQDKSADRALRKAVIRSLSRTKGLNTARITVRVKNGVVMLQGSVPDQSEVDLATRAASNTAGVTSVRNSLTIQGPMGSE